MTADHWKTVEKVFNKSVTLPPEQRKAYVMTACAGDADLIADVLSLLVEADKDNSFLSSPVFEVGAKILASEYLGLFDEPNFAAYEMQKILGRGGSGVVFLAKDVALERLVAIKVLPKALSDNDERILRFRQEARAASAISHPNVAHIYGFGKADDRYYLTMEYVQGNTLREILKKNKINREFALSIACQVARALTAAHEAEIIHRDVKPENIIVTDDGAVKVLDFGLAKPLAALQGQSEQSSDYMLDTKPGMIIGTAAYMSPEQIRGQSLDWRTDIWSLGVVLFEMLIGRRPFVGDTSSDVQARILLTEPEYAPEVEEMAEIKHILDKTLAKEINRRYEKTTDLLFDLETARKNLSVENKVFRHSFSPFASINNGAQPNNNGDQPDVSLNERDNKKIINREAFGEKEKIKDDKMNSTSEKFHFSYKILIVAGVFLIVLIVLIRLIY